MKVIRWREKKTGITNKTHKQTEVVVKDLSPGEDIQTVQLRRTRKITEV